MHYGQIVSLILYQAEDNSCLLSTVPIRYHTRVLPFHLSCKLILSVINPTLLISIPHTIIRKRIRGLPLSYLSSWPVPSRPVSPWPLAICRSTYITHIATTSPCNTSRHSHGGTEDTDSRTRGPVGGALQCASESGHVGDSLSPGIGLLRNLGPLQGGRNHIRVLSPRVSRQTLDTCTVHTPPCRDNPDPAATRKSPIDGQMTIWSAVSFFFFLPFPIATAEAPGCGVRDSISVYSQVTVLISPAVAVATFPGAAWVGCSCSC